MLLKGSCVDQDYIYMLMVSDILKIDPKGFERKELFEEINLKYENLSNEQKEQFDANLTMEILMPSKEEYMIEPTTYTVPDFLSQFGNKRELQERVFQFKNVLRENNFLIRDSLYDIHVTVFEDVIMFVEKRNMTWTEAFKEVIEEYGKDNLDIPEQLDLL